MTPGSIPENPEETPPVEEPGAVSADTAEAPEPATEVQESVVDPQLVEPTPPPVASPEPETETETEPSPVQEKAAEAQDAVQEKAAQIQGAVQEKTAQVQDTVQEKTAQVQDTVQEKTAQVQDTVQEKTAQVQQQTDDHPEYLVGGAFAGGLALALVLRKLGS